MEKIKNSSYLISASRASKQDKISRLTVVKCWSLFYRNTAHKNQILYSILLQAYPSGTGPNDDKGKRIADLLLGERGDISSFKAVGNSFSKGGCVLNLL
jgi:hypothetical protein